MDRPKNQLKLKNRPYTVDIHKPIAHNKRERERLQFRKAN